MLKEYSSVLKRLLIILDLAVLSTAFILAYNLRMMMGEFDSFSSLSGLMPFFLLIWVCLLHYFGMYRPLRMMPFSRILIVVGESSVLSFLAFMSLIYLLKVPYISRAFLVMLFSLSVVMLVMDKVCVLVLFRWVLAKGINCRNILIIGTGRKAENFINLLERHAEWGYKIVGLLCEDPEKVGQEICGYRVVGSLEGIGEALHSRVVDEVVFVVSKAWFPKIEETMRLCDTEGVKIHLALDYFNLDISRARPTELNGFPLLTFESTTDKLWHLLIKRLFDLVVSFMMLFFIMPLFMLICLMIKFTSRGPVFFVQKRCGLNGRVFSMYKFRTMVCDAESRLTGLIARNEMQGPVFKIKNDPRITPLGKILRRTSLDELPQLINVLQGHMSMVGPRPPIPAEVKKYQPWHRRRLSMRPGITCLWQVNGRNTICNFDRWMELDLDYIDHWSLWLDFKIMCKTIPAVLNGSGAA